MKNEYKQTFIAFLLYLMFFAYFQSIGIYGGDAGDLAVSAYVGGFAHPPGYPLYSFLCHVASYIPLSTVAWRVSLVSSIPTALMLGGVFCFLKQLTKSVTISFLTGCTLAFTYVFWLYGTVPEVFGLNAFFIILLLNLSYAYYKNPQFKILGLLVLCTGLSLTHHHIVVFTFPALALLLWHRRKEVVSYSPLEKARIVVLGLIGLLPYSWVYIAAKRVVPIMWDDPINVGNFVNLVTRAQYGSFQSGVSIGQTIQSRFLQIPALFDFYIQDFTAIGLFFAFFGAVYLYSKNKTLWSALFAGFLFTGPLYFFYASYLFRSQFQIATAERFVTPSYVFLALFMGYGVYGLSEFTTSKLANISSVRVKRLRHLVYTVIVGFFALIPLSLFIINYPKISILKYDLTAEHFGRDILNSVEKDSILLMRSDHPVFNTQYVYYAEELRQDVKIIHLTKLANDTDRRVISKYFPDVTLPKYTDPIPYTQAFIDQNYGTFPIYATGPIDFLSSDYVWIPMGVVYKLYTKEDLPVPDVITERNKDLWSMYYDPLDGSLGKYPNLMQVNIGEFYRDGAMRSGVFSQRVGNYEESLEYFDYASSLDPDNGYIHFLRAESFIQLGQCETAKQAIQDGYERRSDDKEGYYLSQYNLYNQCYDNQAEAKVWEEKLNDLDTQEQLQLEEL